MPHSSQVEYPAQSAPEEKWLYIDNNLQKNKINSDLQNFPWKEHHARTPADCQELNLQFVVRGNISNTFIPSGEFCSPAKICIAFMTKNVHLDCIARKTIEDLRHM